MLQLTGLIIALVFLQVSSVFAEDDVCSHWAAKITSMQGVVEIRKHTTQEWIPAKLNDSLCISDSLRTAPHSRATVQIQEETFMVLKERSTVRFSSKQENTQGIFSELLNLFNGEAYLRSRRPRELGIETPFVNAMHEGTEFLVKVNQDSTQVVVFDGVVVASNDLGEIRVSAGESALAKQGRAPVIGPRIELRDAVQWTLYYPPVIDYSVATQNQSNSILKPALDRFQSNDLTGAFESLETVAESQRNADYHILYASLLLTVGQVEQASQHLDQAQQTSTQNANVVALRSIIALAKNDRQTALKLAQQAQQISPKTAAPNIALSYAYQALFDIDKALDSAIQAAQAAPDNGLAWARVSEMQLATSNVDDSMQAAKKAQTLNPKLAKTNTVLGFARLASLDLSDAEQSFRTAIQRDPSDPLARLGLGLAKIRQGHIKSGTKDMETAANLDPDNALIRSYLGKAYYEQRRGDIASTEYAIAKELDPKDPTPWFYDAIYKQTVNRPVEALHDMQKAIELNDNRAVFRSKLLLDEDLAARSTNFARIYTDLGFSRVALKQAWNSLGYDSTNHSPHRFLSDAYIGQPRFRTARASELLQAQLLQPLNTTPVQPQLTSENIGILNSTGPGSLSLNEYDQLYTSNGAHILSNGSIGSNNTKTDNVILSGIYNKFSLSLGQFHYRNDGFRKNDGFKQDVYNAFLQYSFSSNLSFQLELKSDDVRAGDLPFRLMGFHRKNLKKTIEHDLIRAGGHYRIDSSQDLIISAFYTTRKDAEFNSRPPFITAPTLEETSDVINDKGYQTEMQYIFHSDIFDVTAGFGYMNLKSRKQNKKSTIADVPRRGLTNLCNLPGAPPPVEFCSNSRTNPNTDYVNGYIYSKQHLLPNLTSILGLSYDTYDDSFAKKQQLNPKLGLIWNPKKNLTIRGAAFRSLKRPLASNQTIEPTQIAGFNQFFDVNNGTSFWNYGFGIDYNPIQSIYFGGEVTWRNNRQPIIEKNRSKNQDRNEIAHLAYFYWLPYQWVSLRSEYHYERTRSDFVSGEGDLAAFPSGLETQHVPISLNFYHHTGLFAKFTGNFVNQRVEMVTDSTLEKGNENFWTFDATVGYRLPKKMGLISFEARNIFDNKFNYQSTFDASGPQLSDFVPELQVFGKLSLFY